MIAMLHVRLARRFFGLILLAFIVTILIFYVDYRNYVLRERAIQTDVFDPYSFIDIIVDNNTANKSLDITSNNLADNTQKSTVDITPKTISTTKYLLQWTHDYTVPFQSLRKGKEAFEEIGCAVTNCFVTHNRTLLGDYTKFDAILFHAAEYTYRYKAWNHGVPDRRSPKQKYIFASIESSHNYPACDAAHEGYFNWTWTYKLDSDRRWGYIVVRDMTGNVVGPRKSMNWLEHMKPASDDLKKSLKTKSKAAAWFVSNCHSKSRREVFVQELKKELSVFHLTVDVYGQCGSLSCPRDNNQVCWDRLKSDYYFYLSFENSFSEDYVTEKVLHGLQNTAVPIVFGGANYTRFLPPGSYLNARELGAKELARRIFEATTVPDVYHDFFRWTNHYTFHGINDRPDTHSLCSFCAALHDEKAMKEVTVYKDFRHWWNGDLQKLC